MTHSPRPLEHTTRVPPTGIVLRGVLTGSRSMSSVTSAGCEKNPASTFRRACSEAPTWPPALPMVLEYDLVGLYAYPAM